MRALRKLAAGPGLELTTVPLPDLGPRDVRIRVRLAGICGTDKHIFDWDPWAASRITPPVTVGHEFVGIVEALGSAVSRVALGQRVAGEGHIGCDVHAHVALEIEGRLHCDGLRMVRADAAGEGLDRAAHGERGAGADDAGVAAEEVFPQLRRDVDGGAPQ